MIKKLIVLVFCFSIFSNLNSMDNKPYHHLPDNTFRNPEGSPVRDDKIKWSYSTFNKEKKYPKFCARRKFRKFNSHVEGETVSCGDSK